MITGDIVRGATANFSRYSKERFIYPDPVTDPEGFIDKLVDLAKTHASPETEIVIMPMYNEVYHILCNKERFEGVAKIVLPPKDAYELVRNKAKLALHCEKLGIRIPLTIVVENAEDFYARAHEMKYPALVKIPESSGAIGIRKVLCYDEAVEVFDEMVRNYKIKETGSIPILQELVGGTDHCSAFLFDNGEYRASMTYRNVVDYPKGKGVGALRETVDAPVLEEIGRKLLGGLVWNGVCEIDFRWDGVNEPWLIEINPRFWGGLAQSIESGWEYPLWMYDLAIRGHIEIPQIKKIDVRTVNPALMSLRMIQDIFSGRIKDLPKLFKEQRGALNEYFSWDDPMPVLGLIYPLTVYLKYGKITPELLVGEKGTHKRV